MNEAGELFPLDVVSTIAGVTQDKPPVGGRFNFPVLLLRVPGSCVRSAYQIHVFRYCKVGWVGPIKQHDSLESGGVALASNSNIQPSYVKAALWMAGWLLAMLVLLVAGREATRELNVFQVMELRSLIGLVMLYPLIRMHGGFRSMSTSRPLQQFGRNAAHYAAQYLWFVALGLIPIAQVVSIEFTLPIWTAILAAFFLGEQITARKSLAIALGLIGVVVIVRPGFGASNPGQIIMLVAAVGFGISIVMMKSLTRTDAVVIIIFWMLVIQSAIGFVPALYVWSWPSAHAWLWLLAVAFCGTYSHYCMTSAMRYADATIVVPMDFLRVPLSAAVGWLVYAERLDVFTAVGAAIILLGNLLNLSAAKAPTEVPARASTR